MYSKRRINAFTLIEILLALAVGSMLLTAVSVYLVSLAHIWFIKGDDHFFDQHVEGVIYFLNKALKQSEISNDYQTSSITWNRPPGYSEFDEPLLTFNLKEIPALLAMPGRDYTDLTCYLYFQKSDGLYLLWYSNLREIEDIDDVHRTVLSPLLNSIRYCYYKTDDDKWEILDSPDLDQRRKPIVPDFLLLKFEHDGEFREMPLHLPLHSKNVSIF